MNHWTAPAFLGLLLLGCMPASPPGSPGPDAGPPGVLVARALPRDGQAADTAPRPAGRPDTLASALDRRLAADSARDADILQQLHDVELPAAAAETEFDLASGFDINVARYADHPRVRYYLDFFQGRARERMAVWLERLPRYEPMIREALASHSLPGDFVYLGLIESGYSNTAVSRSRAVGMWQFMRATGREYGLRVDRWVDERRDPIKATRAAARYLADLTARLGSHYLAAAAYNGGPGTVMRGLRRLGDAPAVEDEEAEDVEVVADDQFFRLSDTRYLRQETKDYVPKLIAAAMIAKQPEKYGFAPVTGVVPYAVDSVPVTGPTTLEAVARASETPLEDVVRLNPHLLRRVTPPGPLAWVRVPPGRGPATEEALAALPRRDRLAATEHEVKRGETLSSIGRRYGVSASALSEFNGGITSRGLKAGATLLVPAGAARAALAEGPGGPAVNGIHTVRRGETLGAIARDYRVSVAQLRAWNDLGQSSLIRAGQRLRVAPASRAASGSRAAPAGTHLVRRGETLSGLARRYGVSVQSLMEANGLRSPEALKAGVRIDIPS
jgi:membrane-bound lytic murein transglycosylase D